MSVKIMSRVWDDSMHTGSALLMLLAIADHANDDGVCWPSISTLAEKARVKPRQAQNLIAQLRESGELSVMTGRGRNNTSIYVVTIGGKGATQRSIDYAEKVQSSAENTQSSDAENTQSSAENTQSSVIKHAIAIAPEPLEPSIEPSDNNNNSSASSEPATPIVSEPQPQQPPQPQPEAPAIDPADWARVRTVYEGNFGMFTSLLVERVKEALYQHPADMVVLAMDRAVSANRRRWDYVEGVLRNWAAEGYGDAGTKNTTVGVAAKSRGTSRSGDPAGGNPRGAGAGRTAQAAAPEGLREWLIATGQVPAGQAAD